MERKSEMEVMCNEGSGSAPTRDVGFLAARLLQTEFWVHFVPETRS